MATFLILPPRELLEHAFREFANRILPGVTLPADVTEDFLERILPVQTDDTYAVHREDLPDGDNLASILCEAFGGESGDRIVEVGPPRALSVASLRESIIPAFASTVRAAR